MRIKTLKVFEHQRIKVGEELPGGMFEANDFQLLVEFAQKESRRFFYIETNLIIFTQYVGAILLGRLVVEILPKLDQDEKAPAFQWQELLLDMLAYCDHLPVFAPTHRMVHGRSPAFIERFFSLFLDQVDLLCKRGLLRQYQSIPQQLRVWKGQVLWPQHLARNGIHQEYVFASVDEYTTDYWANRIIVAALRLIVRWTNIPVNNARASQLIASFSDVSDIMPGQLSWDHLPAHEDRKDYTTTLRMARSLLENQPSGIKAGKSIGLALLFDMNRLFEEYVFRQIQITRLPGLVINTQASRLFWQERKLKADLIVQYKDQTVVMDTKWKRVPLNTPPSMEDLRQIFVYLQYFNATKGVLIYPVADTSFPFPARRFAAIDGTSNEWWGQLFWLPVIKNGRLNPDAGKELLEALF